MALLSLLVPLLACLPTLPGSTAKALDLSELCEPNFTVFTARDGVPDGVVSALGHDAQGYVWLISSQGLARYDGHSWEAAGPKVGPNSADLLLDSAGTLWASLLGDGLAHYDGRKWHRLEAGRELPAQAGKIRRVVELKDEAGRSQLWALSLQMGLLRQQDGRWLSDEENASLPNAPTPSPISLARTKQLGGEARLWLGTGMDGLCYRPVQGPWRRFSAPGLALSQVEDLLVLNQPEGEELWIAGFGSGIFRLNGQGVRGWTAETGQIPSNLVYRLVASRTKDGSQVLWAATRNGLVRIQGESTRIFDSSSGLPSDVVRNLYLWRSPTGQELLWISTERGVARTQTGGEAWSTASRLGAGGLGVFGVWVEPDEKGGERLWAASTGESLALYEQGQWRQFKGELPPFLRMVKRLPDEQGRSALWVSATPGTLFRSYDNRRFQAMAVPWTDDKAEVVLDMSSRLDAQGQVELFFACRRDGIHHLYRGHWAEVGESGRLPGVRATQLVEQLDDTGRSWLWASTDRGLARYGSDGWQNLTLNLGSAAHELVGLSLIEEDGRQVLWLGSLFSGVLRVDISDPVNPQPLPSEELPPSPDPCVYSASADGTGRIFLATNQGVQMLTRGEGGYSSRLFHRRDGMTHEECNTNGQFIDDHGRFWTGTLAGLAVYDPGDPLPGSAAQPVVLKGVEVDGQQVETEDLQLPAAMRSLRVHFALLGWHRERETSFRTQLIGYEPQPGPWSGETTAVLGKLPPGSYRLRVEARDYAATASKPLELPLRIIPSWWQRAWFHALLVLVFVFIGPLVYFVRIRHLTRQRRQLESLVAARTSELAHANEQLNQLIRQDPLTRLANRRHLEEALDLEWRRATRSRTPLAMLLLDVDHFKAYNDSLGHQAGDQCLKTVADLLADALNRAGELVARYGGEEFAVVLPGQTPQAALATAEHVRSLVQEAGLPHPQSLLPVLTVSIGVASLQPGAECKPADLIAAADQALYEAKRSGRNQARLASYSVSAS
jgi:diguanylate cyclase (GGDEF)-like protein